MALEEFCGEHSVCLLACLRMCVCPYVNTSVLNQP